MFDVRYCNISVSPQYEDSTSPAVYFNFEQDQCWINHGVQFVTELARISSVSHPGCSASSLNNSM